MQLHSYTTNKIIEGLLCGTSYQIFLTAFNDIGRGEPSAVIEVATEGRGESFGHALKSPIKTIHLASETTVIIYAQFWPLLLVSLLFFIRNRFLEEAELHLVLRRALRSIKFRCKLSPLLQKLCWRRKLLGARGQHQFYTNEEEAVEFVQL